MMSQTIFPQDPILERLVAASQRLSDPEPMIHDEGSFLKSYAHLLGDIFRTRTQLLQTLPDAVLADNGLLRDDSPYILLFARTGYEFLVGFFAIRAVGGAPMPLIMISDELQSLRSDTKVSCVLFADECASRAAAICRDISELEDEDEDSVPFVSCQIFTDAQPQPAADVTIDVEKPLDPNGPGVVLQTSGVSAHPKMAVLPRHCFVTQHFADPEGVALSYRPCWWIGGTESLLMPVLTGQSLYCLGSWATSQQVMDAFLDCSITSATFSPVVLKRMMNRILGPTGVLSDDARWKYSSLFRGLTSIMCGGATIEPSVREFWENLTGLPFENFYGSTEIGARICSSISGPQGCIGSEPMPDMEMKLSAEPVGEILVRAPCMIRRYILDAEESRADFDEDGFLRTGDIGKLVNGQYFFLGRMRSDYVHFDNLHIPTTKVESAIRSLPYIEDAWVVGVPNPDIGELTGVVVRPATRIDDTSRQEVSLAEMRDDLREMLPGCMLPFLLRVLDEDELVPLTPSSKTSTVEVIRAYFGPTLLNCTTELSVQLEVWPEIPSIEEWDITPDGISAWDWDWLQSDQAGGLPPTHAWVVI